MVSWDSVSNCWLAGVLSLWGFSVVSEGMSSSSASSPSSLSLISFPSSSAEENSSSFSCLYSGVGESGVGSSS